MKKLPTILLSIIFATSIYLVILWQMKLKRVQQLNRNYARNGIMTAPNGLQTPPEKGFSTWAIQHFHNKEQKLLTALLQDDLALLVEIECNSTIPQNHITHFETHVRRALESNIGLIELASANDHRRPFKHPVNIYFKRELLISDSELIIYQVSIIPQSYI